MHLEAIALARSPHGAGEISQAIGRKHGGAFKRRNEKSARQVSLVVLDAMEFRANRVGIGAECLRQRIGNSHEFREYLGAFPRKSRHPQRVKKLGAQARPGIPGNGDVIDFRELQSGNVEAITDGRRRKTSGVLDAVEAFLLHGGNKLSVADHGSRSIPVIRINAQNIHLAYCFVSGVFMQMLHGVRAVDQLPMTYSQDLSKRGNSGGSSVFAPGVHRKFSFVASWETMFLPRDAVKERHT